MKTHKYTQTFNQIPENIIHNMQNTNSKNKVNICIILKHTDLRHKFINSICNDYMQAAYAGRDKNTNFKQYLVNFSIKLIH